MKLYTSLTSKAVIIALILCSFTNAFSQKKGKKKGVKPEQKKEKVKSLEEVSKSCKAYSGLFTIYQDTVTGATYLQVSEEQIGKEYIYFSYVEDAAINTGFTRGRYRGSKIFSVNKYFEKIELVGENTSYYFDSNNAVSKAKNANINRPVYVSQAIFAKSKDKSKFLIKADPIFLSEAFQQVKRSPRPGAKNKNPFGLGSLKKEKSKYLQLKSYPKNTDVIVEYVYQKDYPTNYGRAEVTDARFVSIKLQHSIIEVPKNDYSPRRDDPRVGYFMQAKNDMTSPEATPYHDVINRWNLVKKDKGAALSEPVEPITWWMENTTPMEIRETVKNAVLQWNIAFEKAGFKNAVVVKQQPDDADWDAGDIRYNVLRWTSSPSPPFGGYGPSFVNPRTGQILGADIMLEFIYLTNRLKQEKMFATSAMDFISTENEFNENNCMAGDFMHNNNLFTYFAAGDKWLPDGEMSTYFKESLYYLLMHEVGHTLGLNHNMKATSIHDLNDVHNKEKTEAMGLQGSVMDYPAINIALDISKQGNYSTTRPGPYDLWAIEYGYSEALENPIEEEKRLSKILSRSSDPLLTFGNDADDMRAPGKGLDPRVMVGDMSSDVIGYSKQRIELVNNLMGEIKDKYTSKGQSYHELRSAYLMLTREYWIACRVTSRYIGGVYVDRSFAGQEGAGLPYQPVKYEDQKRAMQLLADACFGVNAFKFPTDIFNYLQHQRRGFSHWGAPEDPKIHDRALAMQKDVLNHLLHPIVLKRLTDSELYGNNYSVAEFLTDLTDAIFKNDLQTNVSSLRRNLQVEYVNRLTAILKGKHDHNARSIVHLQLNKINKSMATASSTNAASKAHRGFISFTIEKALDSK